MNTAAVVYMSEYSKLHSSGATLSTATVVGIARSSLGSWIAVALAELVGSAAGLAPAAVAVKSYFALFRI